MHLPNISMRQALNRRTLLKAAGVVLALPLLEAMCPALAYAADKAAYVLLVFDDEDRLSAPRVAALGQ